MTSKEVFAGPSTCKGRADFPFVVSLSNHSGRSLDMLTASAKHILLAAGRLPHERWGNWANRMAVDGLRNPFYSSRHPRGSHV